MHSHGLRPEGVYTMPDGREFIAGAGYGGVYSLYTPEAWNNYGEPEYRVRADGRVYRNNVATPLRVEHLTDTGARARFWKSHRLL